MTTERDELSALIHSTSDTFPDSDAGVIAVWSDELADAALAAGYRRPRVIETAADRDSLPAGTVVRSASGTIACLHHAGVGTLFGDERTFYWNALALPITVLWEGGE